MVEELVFIFVLQVKQDLRLIKRGIGRYIPRNGQLLSKSFVYHYDIKVKSEKNKKYVNKEIIG